MHFRASISANPNRTFGRSVVLIAIKLAARSRFKRRLTKIVTLWGLTTIFPSKHEIGSRQLVKQRLSVLQYRRVETFR
jgi:hypothetical protein